MSEPTVIHMYTSLDDEGDPVLTMLYLSDGTVRWVDGEFEERRPKLRGLTLAQLDALYDGHRRRA